MSDPGIEPTNLEETLEAAATEEAPKAPVDSPPKPDAEAPFHASPQEDVVPPTQVSPEDVEDSSEGSGGEDMEAAMHVPKHAPSSRISEKKIQERLRRVFQIKADGTYKVPEDLRKDYLNKHTRKKIEALFEKVNFDPDGVSQKSFACFGAYPFFRMNEMKLKHMFKDVFVHPKCSSKSFGHTQFSG